MKLSPIVFDQYPASPSGLSGTAYTDTPVMSLEPLADVFERHPAQNSVLRSLALALTGQAAIFGPALDWACRPYIVHRQLRSPNKARTIGVRPAQPVVAQQRVLQIDAADGLEKSGILYLFNVLVAVEWTPDAAYLAQLEWAFRRASDFLYDVTDGCMAFGQVVFGGRELMDCADIQILASNRLHPRSWVAGFHEAHKYTPVRLGRGMWSRRNQITIGWDEPEAYRALVHEWAHYALCLRDRYLRPEERALDKRPMVLPDCAIASSTIMATLEGTSELVAHRGEGGGRESDWTRMRRRFGHLPTRPLRLAGPGALPLPLPAFHRTGSLAHDGPQPPAIDRSFVKLISAGDELDRCWAFVIHKEASGAPRLLAQGTLDLRVRGDIALYGASTGDEIVVVFQGSKGDIQLFRGVVADQGTTQLAPDESGQALIDVLPRVQDAGLDKPDTAFVAVRVVSHNPPEQVLVFPLGSATEPIDFGRPDGPDWQSETKRIPTLDGHVLLRWTDGSVQIATFSQGGGPPSHGPVSGSPVTAGSSNGNVMIFFRDTEWKDPEEQPDQQTERDNDDYSDVKVITTLLPGVDPRLPGRHANATRGYVYSLAATTALPAQLTPTLVMYYSASRLDEEAKPRIYREVDGHWEELAVYPSPRCGYVAVPLDAVSASRLVDEYPDGPRVERYRLVWA